jgi:hypothetical protein
VELDASSSFDPEGDALSYGWAFDDGSESETGVVVSHTFDRPGRYEVLLAVKDEKGAVGTATALIEAPPGLVFADGFETGDTGHWSALVP